MKINESPSSNWQIECDADTLLGFCFMLLLKQKVRCVFSLACGMAQMAMFTVVWMVKKLINLVIMRKQKTNFSRLRNNLSQIDNFRFLEIKG